MENENITTRRRTKRLSFSENESLLDISYQSLPNLIEDKQYTLELKNELEKLTLELNVANNEIDNLNSENVALKQKLIDCETTIKRYKTVCHSPGPSSKCSTPLKFCSPQFRKQIATTTKMGIPKTSPNQLSNNALMELYRKSTESQLPAFINENKKSRTYHCSKKYPDVASIVDITSPNTSEHIPANILQNQTYHSGDKTKQSPNSLDKRKIFLFADEKGRHMRQILQQLVGNNYIVCSMIKQNANMEQVLMSCVSQCKNLTKSDYVIILAGSHDSNIRSLESNLKHSLSLLTHTNVIVGNVCRNMCIDEYSLNTVLHQICCLFDNVMYADLIDYHSENPKMFHRIHACRLLLRQTLKIEYMNKFIMYKKKQESLYSSSVCTQTNIVNYHSASTQTSEEFFRC